jgi:hypothetical protein
MYLGTCCYVTLLGCSSPGAADRICCAALLLPSWGSCNLVECCIYMFWQCWVCGTRASSTSIVRSEATNVCSLKIMFLSRCLVDQELGMHWKCC